MRLPGMNKRGGGGEGGGGGGSGAQDKASAFKPLLKQALRTRVHLPLNSFPGNGYAGCQIKDSPSADE